MTVLRDGQRAGLAYFAIVFAAGVLLGTLRALLLAPMVGPLPAVLIEIPVMLVIAWVACRWIIRRLAVPDYIGERITMGVVAFAFLMIAEYLLALSISGISLPAYAAAFATAPGLAGLVAQLAFATFPVLQRATPPARR